MRFWSDSSSTRARRRVAALAVIGAVVLAACGGSDDAADSVESPDAEAAPGATVAAGDEAEAPADEGASDGAAVATGAGFVDLGGPEVAAEANIETNLLPDVVVDDVTNDRKVNFRNLVPQDKPVLLWMYAPH